MFFAAQLPLVSGSVLLILLAWAVASDLRERRIPNRLVLSGMALAVALHGTALLYGTAALAGPHPWSPLSGALVGGSLMLPLYLLRASGAGDVKLMAMAGAFVGPAVALSAVLYTLVAGGLLSLLVMLWRGVTAQALANVRLILCDWGQRVGAAQGLRLRPLDSTAARLPYALAISAGCALALWRPLLLLD